MADTKTELMPICKLDQIKADLAGKPLKAALGIVEETCAECIELGCQVPFTLITGKVLTERSLNENNLAL